MDYKYIKKDFNERGVTTVTLNRAEVHNAFNEEMIEEVITAFIKLKKCTKTRVVVLTGFGKSFCAGADLNWMSSMVDYSMEENVEDSKKLAKMFETINDFEKPVIGKINGHALGGGVGLVAVCDYAITHDRAKFGFTEVRLGLIPAVISPYCINKIGESHARAWFLSGEMFKGAKAQNIGLIHEVTSFEDYNQRVDEVISSHLQAAPEAAIVAKKLIRTVLNTNKEELTDITCSEIAKKRISSEGQEGMKALLNKTKPKWIENEN
jgi:methylglutaconyl-CoA hydratase